MMRPNITTCGFALNQDFDRRTGFIRKVYAILFIQLASVAGACAYMATHQHLADYLLSTGIVPVSAFLVAFGSYLALLRVERLRKTAPMNMALLALFTLGQGLQISLATSSVPLSILSSAAVQTLVIAAVA